MRSQRLAAEIGLPSLFLLEPGLKAALPFELQLRQGGPPAPRTSACYGVAVPVGSGPLPGLAGGAELRGLPDR